MARNLLDDDDWNRLASTVSAAVSSQIEITENGILARIDKRLTDQAGILEVIRAAQGEPPAEVTALRSQITDVAALVAQLRRVIGSGNLETEVNAQVSSIFADLAARLGTPVIPNVPDNQPEEAPPEDEES